MMRNKELLKLRAKINMLCSICLILVVALIYVAIRHINNIEKENKEIKAQNSCYQLLYNEDYIGIGCDKYFENDTWYIEYKEQEKRNNNE